MLESNPKDKCAEQDLHNYAEQGRAVCTTLASAFGLHHEAADLRLGAR